ncbi:MAG: UDP-N-acetylenolpyruvoylglucosamine reductase, partial [Acidimicrobiia bacterium]
MTGDLDRLATTLAAALPGQVERNVALGALTTWRVGGQAAIRVRMETDGDGAIVASSLPPDVPLAVVGRGSNLLVADAGFAGVVLTLGSGFDSVEIASDHVVAGAATALPVLARRSAAAGR